jgi:hypothetical protein
VIRQAVRGGISLMFDTNSFFSHLSVQEATA